MILEKSEIINSKHLDLDFDFTPTKEQKEKMTSLIEFNYAHAKVKVDYVSDLALINLMVKGKMVLKSTRSLKPINFPFSDNDVLTLSFFKKDDMEDESIIYWPEDKIDLDSIVWSMIITSVPIKVVGKDEPECFSGDNWEVISEEEYEKKKSKKKDSRFDELDSFFDEKNN